MLWAPNFLKLPLAHALPVTGRCRLSAEVLNYGIETLHGGVLGVCAWPEIASANGWGTPSISV